MVWLAAEVARSAAPRSGLGAPLKLRLTLGPCIPSIQSLNTEALFWSPGALFGHRGGLFDQPLVGGGGGGRLVLGPTRAEPTRVPEGHLHQHCIMISRSMYGLVLSSQHPFCRALPSTRPTSPSSSHQGTGTPRAAGRRSLVLFSWLLLWPAGAQADRT
jgi:hypothetical protein